MKNDRMNNFQVLKTNNTRRSTDNNKLSSTNINSNNVLLTNGVETNSENIIKPEINGDCFVTNDNLMKTTNENLSDKLNFNKCSEFDKLHDNNTTLNGLISESIIRNNVDENKKHLEKFLTNERLRMQSECSVESTDSESFIVFDDSLNDGTLNNNDYFVCKPDDYFDSENSSSTDDDDDDSSDDSEDDFVYDDDSEENGSADKYASFVLFLIYNNNNIYTTRILLPFRESFTLFFVMTIGKIKNFHYLLTL